LAAHLQQQHQSKVILTKGAYVNVNFGIGGAELPLAHFYGAFSFMKEALIAHARSK